MTVLAVDLGGTELRVGLVDAAGTVLGHRRTPTDATGGPQAVVAQIAGLAAALDPSGAATRLGVAAPGPLDPVAGVVLGAPNLRGWEDVPLRDMLAGRLGRTVVLENDAAAACLGEWRFGAGAGTHSMVYVTISTGIGGGAIVDGALLHGRRGMAAEIGHMSLTQDPVPCACGGTGCWEALAAGPALLAAARRVGAATSGAEIEAAARAGDPVCRALLAEEARWLGIGFANLLHLYSPQRLVVGGGVASCLDLMRPTIEATLRGRVMPPYRDVPVVAAALGPHAGLIGAASLVL